MIDAGLWAAPGSEETSLFLGQRLVADEMADCGLPNTASLFDELVAAARSRLVGPR